MVDELPVIQASLASSFARRTLETSSIATVYCCMLAWRAKTAVLGYRHNAEPRVKRHTQLSLRCPLAPASGPNRCSSSPVAGSTWTSSGTTVGLLAQGACWPAERQAAVGQPGAALHVRRDFVQFGCLTRDYFRHLPFLLFFSAHMAAISRTTTGVAARDWCPLRLRNQSARVRGEHPPSIARLHFASANPVGGHDPPGCTAVPSAKPC